MTVVSVLGGGSPFTIGLAQAMRDQLDPDDRWELRLLGRDLARTRGVADAVVRRFAGTNWPVTATVELEDACRDADVIVHQARIGGHEQRAADEQVARLAGLPADETMGPAGLRAALRIFRPTQELARRIAHVNDHAPVLVMANPLAVSTRAFWSEVGDRAIGVCEVPLLTEQHLGETRHDDGSPQFGYIGWNHRGFHWFVDERRLSQVATIPAWTDLDFVRRLGAWPSKQIGELLTPLREFAPRAERVAEISRRLAAEMTSGDDLSSEGLRETPWYDLAVVPAIRAVTGTPAWLPVTTCLDGGHASEQYVLLSPEGVMDRAAAGPPPAEVARWHADFSRHQQLVDAAVTSPSFDRIAETLAADPLLPCPEPEIAHALARSLR